MRKFCARENHRHVKNCEFKFQPHGTAHPSLQSTHLPRVLSTRPHPQLTVPHIQNTMDGCHTRHSLQPHHVCINFHRKFSYRTSYLKLVYVIIYFVCILFDSVYVIIYFVSIFFDSCLCQISCISQVFELNVPQNNGTSMCQFD